MKSATFRAKRPKLKGTPILVKLCVIWFFVALLGLIVTAAMSGIRYTIVMTVFIVFSVLFCLWSVFSLIFVTWEDEVVIKFSKDNMSIRYKDLMSNKNVKHKFLCVNTFRYVGNTLRITGKTDLAQEVSLQVKCVLENKGDLIEMLNEFKGVNA